MIKLEGRAGAVHEPVYLLVDGIRQENVHIGNHSGGFDVSVHEDELINKLMRHTTSDFPSSIIRIHLYTNLRLIKGEQHISQHLILHKEAGHHRIAFHFLFAVENWKRLWSVSEYQHEFKRIFEEQNLTGARWATGSEMGIADVMNPFTRIILSCPLDDDATIESESRKHSGLLTRLHELTESSLISKLRRDSVVMHFDFPEEVKVPCEQYLLYFAQFLRDLGVQADTALTHEAGQVLFTVTPADKEQALDKIHAALNAYLHLPSNPISDAADESIAVQRLESNILRLRSDLKLAAAELQAKNTTIEAQQLIIEVQKGLLSGEVIVNSMKDVTPKPKDKDKEELLGGTVSIIPLKGKGLEINLPELFRRLKRLFKEE